MKKIFIFCLMALVMCVNANAEKVVGNYHQGSTKYNVEAAINKKNDLIVFIQVAGKYDNDKVYIRIDGVKNINSFIDALNICKTKYIEWSEIANNNNVTDFRKAINVNFPNVEIWWLGSKWYYSHKQNFIKPEFVVLTYSYIVISGKAKHWDNEYIDTSFFMMLTLDDIDELINVLNTDNINSALNEQSKNDDLFK